MFQSFISTKYKKCDSLDHSGGFVQGKRNSSALAMELRLSSRGHQFDIRIIVLLKLQRYKAVLRYCFHLQWEFFGDTTPISVYISQLVYTMILPDLSVSNNSQMDIYKFTYVKAAESNLSKERGLYLGYFQQTMLWWKWSKCANCENR